MIFIDSGKLYPVSGTLKAVCMTLDTCQDSVASVQNHLLSVAGMGDSCASLDDVAHKMDRQLQSCRELYRSIDSICQAYSSCEGKALDYCENGLVQYEQPPAEFQELSSAMDLLREFSFDVDGGGTLWNQVVLK